MPRDLPIGNGSLLASVDQTYQIRDISWPHVGQENHTLVSRQSGYYPFVDHSMRDMGIGATGLLDAGP